MIRLFKQYYPIQSVILFIGESLIVLMGLLLFILLFYPFNLTWVIFLKAFSIMAICQLCLYYSDFYKTEYNNSASKLIQSLIITLIILAIICYFVPQITIGEGPHLFLNICFIGILTYLWRSLINTLFNKDRLTQKILFIGSGNLAKNVAKEILSTNHNSFKILGFLDPDPKKKEKNILNYDLAGTYGELDNILRQNGNIRIVIALDDKRGKIPLNKLLECKMRGIIIEDHITFLERLKGKLMVESLNPSHVIFSDGFKRSKVKAYLKRIEDILGSIIGLIVLSPFLILTAILIKIDSKGPLFFTQERVGENGKPFILYKFRSMKVDAEKDKPLWAKENDDRVTRVGRYIRRFGIDEAPQLWNVLKGDMSLVGPRPERPQFVKELTNIIPYYSLRHSVKPGITGWAQIRYHYGASVEDALEKLKYELYYIKNLSPIFDLFILFETVKLIIQAKISR